MVHFASPLPVLVAVHPGGASPGLASSKPMVSARAADVMRLLMIIMALMVFIVWCRNDCCFPRCALFLRLMSRLFPGRQSTVKIAHRLESELGQFGAGDSAA